MILRSHAKQFKRDGQHETPQAPKLSSIDSGAKSAPGFSPSIQGRTLQGQMVSPDKSAKSINAISNTAVPQLDSTAAEDCDEVIEEEQKLTPDLDQPAPVSFDVKTPEAFHQVQPDSESSDDDREASLPGHAPFHPKRQSNLIPGFERDPKIRIDFPKSSDSAKWKELNQMLEDGLSKAFSQRRIKTYSDSNKLGEAFDDYLHAFFLQHCGEVDILSDDTKPPCSKQKHRGLERLRQEKNGCKKAFSILKKAGLLLSKAGQACKKLWFKLIRTHNKLRRRVRARESQRDRVQSERQFKRNPFKYAQKLFEKESLNGVPSFDKATADAYFSGMYRDADRDATFEPLEGMRRPEPPSTPFFEQAPDYAEVRKHTMSKKSNACPGLNSLPYLIYKKCPAIIAKIHKIFVKIFSDKDIPESWATAFVVLLQKEKGVTDVPKEFRPIAITNTIGKIFFSIISDRLQRFLVKNGYIKTAIQKGFLSGVPGCVEHSFTLWEALKEAKDEARAIVVSWLDLANAYGSVKHNLIQFALRWYHVPESIIKLIFDYYEKLSAKVRTKAWSTDFFRFEIGLFQGCVLSTILFDCVFNLLLDFLDAHKHEGYTFKLIRVTKVTTMHKAYADDLQLTTTTPKGHQRVLDRTQAWLDWTVTMAAKPSKCVCMAFRQFKKGVVSSEGFSPYEDTIYSVYDPKLFIKGVQLKFIVDINKVDEFLAGHFKFLGRWVSRALDDEVMKVAFRSKFFEWLKLVDKDKVNGLMKLWIYQHYVLHRASWTLMVHDFNHHFIAKSIQQPTNVYLRKWAGLSKSSDQGILYRSHKDLGLNLTSVITHFESVKVIYCHLLKHSADPMVAAVYQNRVRRHSSNKKTWRDTQLLEQVEKMVAHGAKFQAASPSDKRGLGQNIYVAHKDSHAEHRKRCGAAVHQLSSEKLLAHTAQLAMNSVWTHWSEKSIPFDLSWRNLVYGPGPRIVSFVLNATMNSLASPDLLALMKITKDGSCKLCGAKQCTLFHILSNCPKSLTDKRYTWRHDSVLATVLQILVPHMIEHNASPAAPDERLPGIAFVKAGAKCRRPTPRQNARKSLLSPARDWQLLIDFDARRILFPPEITPTNERPDIVLWSASTKTVIMIELTCPAEENLDAARARKLKRYAVLCEQIRLNGWVAVLHTVEAGARGFVGNRFFRVFRELGLSSAQASRACKDVSYVTASCSYGLWLMRHSKSWNASRGLMVPSGYITPPPISTPAPLLVSQPRGISRAVREWHRQLGPKAESA